MSNIVAIVGRPNVGKSTLFNRFLERREAIVDSTSGVTRDRHYGKSDWNGVEFTVIDTGGYEVNTEDVFQEEIIKQVELAVDEATSIIFMLNVEEGLTDTDQEIYEMLRRSNKPIYVTVNKVDSATEELAATEFYQLGIEKYYTLSSATGSGTGELLDDIVKEFPTTEYKDPFEGLPKITIAGRPNVGKSTLTNALLDVERNIVTDIAGTTRDVLEEQMNLNGITLNIIDTAGIRDTEDIVEKIGVDKAKDYLVNADLIIYVVDSSTPLDENDEKIMEMIKDRTALVLLNKSDLDTVTTEEMIASHLDQKIIKVSMKENQGVDELENAIKELFFHGKVELNDEVYITNARHKAALSNAKDSLNMVLDSIAMEMPEDFYSIDLMNTYEELGNILGESLGEDLVNEIFSKFCTGK